MRALNVLLFLAAIAVCSLGAQQEPLAFEVASVKPNNSKLSGSDDRTLGCHGTDSHSPAMTIPLGRCVARYEPLKLVVALAYDIPPALLYPYEGKILSGPDWINSDSYDIEAKAEFPDTQAQLKRMLQMLLADRFKLKLHRETKDMPVYALVTSKNGSKLKQAPKDRDCGEQHRRDHQYESSVISLSGQCHGFAQGRGEVMFQGQSVDMSDLAEMLSYWTGRVVLDKTGIQGLFDIQIPRFGSGPSVQPVQSKKDPIAVREGTPVNVEIETLPTIFTVLDKFGLKLESAKGPVEVLVIDSVEKPSEN